MHDNTLQLRIRIDWKQAIVDVCTLGYATHANSNTKSFLYPRIFGVQLDITDGLRLYRAAGVIWNDSVYFGASAQPENTVSSEIQVYLGGQWQWIKYIEVVGYTLLHVVETSGFQRRDSENPILNLEAGVVCYTVRTNERWKSILRLDQVAVVPRLDIICRRIMKSSFVEISSEIKRTVCQTAEAFASTITRQKRQQMDFDQPPGFKFAGEPDGGGETCGFLMHRACPDWMSLHESIDSLNLSRGHPFPANITWIIQIWVVRRNSCTEGPVGSLALIPSMNL
jgi:hypothetical protein